MAATANTQLAGDQVNYLVYRYLQENGFTHAAFAFGAEALISRSAVDPTQIPAGALLSFLQRGLAYVNIESSLAPSSAAAAASVDGAKSLLEVYRALTAPRPARPKPARGAYADSPPPALAPSATPAQPASNAAADAPPAVAASGASQPGAAQSAAAQSAPPGDSDKPATPQEPDSNFHKTSYHQEIRYSDATHLSGHTNEVFAVDWNPRNSLLATGSGDETARIWAVPNSPPSLESSATSITLQHPPRRNLPGAKTGNDVTAAAWNIDGTRLATGSYDGGLRIWNEEGIIVRETHAQKKPIFSVKWNPRCDLVASCGLDKTVAIYRPRDNTTLRHYRTHSLPTLDIDWKDDGTLASCGADKMIYEYSIDQDAPVATYRGHFDEVNCLVYDPSGNLLASASDDCTARVWSSQSSPDALLKLADHTKEVYVVRWSPSTIRSLVLASGSFDRLTKLWDVKTGKCLHTLKAHKQPVYTVEFSPNGEFLATGSFDKKLLIWSARDGQLIRSYKCPAGMFEARWNAAGDRIAVGCGNGTVVIVDPRTNGFTVDPLDNTAGPAGEPTAMEK